jgi:hypothetical protein
VKLTKEAYVTAKLFAPSKKLVQSWRLHLKAGATIVKLRLNEKRLAPGTYTLAWYARSGKETTHRTQRVRIGAGTGAAKAVDVVLTLKGAPTREPQSRGPVRHIYAAGVDQTYSVAAGSANARLIVVDADVYGLGLVRDLRAVFPNVRIVVLSSKPATIAAAQRAGATLALSKSLPQTKLLALIDALARRR